MAVGEILCKNEAIFWPTSGENLTATSFPRSRFSAEGTLISSSTVPNRGDSLAVSQLVTTHHTSWHVGQQRSSSIPVCPWPASGWCPRCGTWSSFPRPQFFARLSSVDHASAFRLGSSGVGILAQHVPNPGLSLPGHDGLHISLLAPVLRGHGWRRFWARRCVRFPWGLSCERTTTWQGHVWSSASTLIRREGSTIRSSGTAFD